MSRNGLILSMIASVSLLAANPPEYAKGLGLYHQTRYREALQTLLPATDKSPSVNQLIGQSYFQIEDYKKATEYLEKAVSQAPESSEAHLWLGRAFGRRAETSSFVTAPGFASKARQHFEKAVEYDQKNLEAVNDLFEYYLQAPGFLGGGLDKAAKLAEWIKVLDPAEFHYAQARLAEKKKEFQTAEQQLRRAAEVAPKSIGRILDLAQFLAKQGRVQESEAAFKKAEEIDPNSPKLMFQRATAYIKQNRNLVEARQLLKRYLDAPLTPDDPSRIEAERMLKQAGS